MRKMHLIVGIIVVVLSLYYVFHDVQIDELGKAFLSLRYVYLIPTIGLVVLGFLFRAMRWRYLIRPVKEVKTLNLLSPLIVGFMGNMLPARAGEFIRAYLLGKQERISFSASFATIFIERLFDMVLVLFLLFWVLFFRAEFLTSENSGETHSLMVNFGLVSFAGVVCILLFSVLLQFKNDWAMKLVGLFTKPFPLKWKEKIIKLVNSFAEGLKILKDKRGFFATVLLSFLIWCTFILTYYPLYLAFDIDTNMPLITSLIILCLTVAVFITLLPTPGFLGAFQAACVAALHGIFGVPKAVAVSYGIVAWFVTMGVTVLLGIFFIIKDNISLGEFSTRKEP